METDRSAAGYGDYKIEALTPKGWWRSTDSWCSQTEARAEIRSRQRSGGWDGCDFYVVNARTGWRSLKVEPKPAKDSR